MKNFNLTLIFLFLFFIFAKMCVVFWYENKAFFVLHQCMICQNAQQRYETSYLPQFVTSLVKTLELNHFTYDQIEYEELFSQKLQFNLARQDWHGWLSGESAGPGSIPCSSGHM